MNSDDSEYDTLREEDKKRRMKVKKIQCNDCEGEGGVGNVRCETCNGSGEVENRE